MQSPSHSFRGRTLVGGLGPYETNGSGVEPPLSVVGSGGDGGDGGGGGSGVGEGATAGLVVGEGMVGGFPRG